MNKSKETLDTITSHPKVKAWLDEFSNHITRKNYRYGITMFFTTADISIDELLTLPPKDVRHVVLAFQNDMKNKSWTDGKINVVTVAVRSFLASNDVIVKFKRNQIIKATKELCKNNM
jgi:hypothetical protein